MAEILFKKYMIPAGIVALIVLLIPEVPGKILLASGSFAIGGVICSLDYLGLLPSRYSLGQRLAAVLLRKE